MTEAVVTTGATICAKLQSNHHQQHTNTELVIDRMPCLSPKGRIHQLFDQRKSDVGNSTTAYSLWLQESHISSLFLSFSAKPHICVRKFVFILLNSLHDPSSLAKSQCHVWDCSSSNSTF